MVGIGIVYRLAFTSYVDDHSTILPMIVPEVHSSESIPTASKLLFPMTIKLIKIIRDHPPTENEFYQASASADGGVYFFLIGDIKILKMLLVTLISYVCRRSSC